MAVHVRMFAALREAAGCAAEEVPAGRLSDVLATLRARHDERFAERLATCAVLVDQRPVSLEQDPTVPDGAEVALLPPFSGGAAERPAGGPSQRDRRPAAPAAEGAHPREVLPAMPALLALVVIVAGFLGGVPAALVAALVGIGFAVDAAAGVGTRPVLLLALAGAVWAAFGTYPVGRSPVALAAVMGAAAVLGLARAPAGHSVAVLGSTMLVTAPAVVGASGLATLALLDDGPATLIVLALAVTAAQAAAALLALRRGRPLHVALEVAAALAGAAAVGLVAYLLVGATLDGILVARLVLVAAAGALVGRWLRRHLTGPPNSRQLAGAGMALLCSAPVAAALAG